MILGKKEKGGRQKDIETGKIKTNLPEPNVINDIYVLIISELPFWDSP